MKIEKAIEELKGLDEVQGGMWRKDLQDAIKLGIEALKRLEQNRTLHFIPSLKLLPGETKE